MDRTVHLVGNELGSKRTSPVEGLSSSAVVTSIDSKSWPGQSTSKLNVPNPPVVVTVTRTATKTLDTDLVAQTPQVPTINATITINRDARRTLTMYDPVKSPTRHLVDGSPALNLSRGSGFSEKRVQKAQSAIGDSQDTPGRPRGFGIHKIAHHRQRDIGNGL